MALDLTSINFDSHEDIPLPLPRSNLYEVRYSSTSGRGVFASQKLSNGTALLVCDIDQNQSTARTTTASHGVPAGSPTAHTILREYRKEVCGECFAYDRGRQWKVKFGKPDAERSSAYGTSHGNLQSGIVFCTEICRKIWLTRYGETGCDAFIALEEAVRKSAKQSKPQPEPLPVPQDHSIAEIRSAWSDAATKAARTVAARTAVPPTKLDRKILRQANEPDEIDQDLCYYLLSGVLSAKATYTGDHDSIHERPKSIANETHPIDHDRVHTRTDRPDATYTNTETTICEANNSSGASSKNILSLMKALAPDPKCYNHPSSTLSKYISTYLFLHAVLPMEILPHLTPTLAHELNSRASHNAFSIRPSESNDGAQSGEFTGWGVWPAASFFNHSCAPNVSKRRNGRQWEFYVHKHATSDSTSNLTGAESVSKDEELCITYLGGEEEDLDVKERRRRLLDGWGFECMCVRCVQEAGT